jgi:hypothetical protein
MKFRSEEWKIYGQANQKYPFQWKDSGRGLLNTNESFKKLVIIDLL